MHGAQSIKMNYAMIFHMHLLNVNCNISLQI